MDIAGVVDDVDGEAWPVDGNVGAGIVYYNYSIGNYSGPYIMTSGSNDFNVLDYLFSANMNSKNVRETFSIIKGMSLSPKP